MNRNRVRMLGFVSIVTSLALGPPLGTLGVGALGVGALGVVLGSTPRALAAQVAGEDELVPPGFGTLRQDDITLSMRSEDLLIKVTPLAESIIRLTAPDTYARLSGLANSRREELVRQSHLEEPSLFLISFFSYEPNVTFQPEDLQLVSQGLRERPLGIVAITPGWDTQRLGQQEFQLALYAFDDRIDLETSLEVEYQFSQNPSWDRILSLLHSEEAKVRARAGNPPG